MKASLYDTVTICGHYLSALINDDYSGLDDMDEDMLIAWTKQYSGMAVIYDCVSEEPEFTRDCVSGLMADCYTVNIIEL